MLTVGAKILPTTFNGAFDDDELGAYVRFDGALSTDGQALGMSDGSLDSPLNQKVFFCGQVAFEK
jgi:hypothetical protein